MIYVTSDLHGYSLERFRDFLDRAGFCDDDTLYVLGDVIDRGADSVKLLMWLMRKKNVRMLMGNHEAMLLSCDFLFEGDTDDIISRLVGTRLNKFRIWTSNSGYVTLNALDGVRDKEIRYILDYLRGLPLFYTLSVNGRSFILTHSGLGGFSEEKPLSRYSADELLWTRPDISTRYYDNATVIFGHTPTAVFGEEHTGRILKTDTWINVDVGVGKGAEPALLRLDDMAELYYGDFSE